MAILVSKDPVEALVQYVQDIKPYHTKIIDVLVEYIYTDPVNVSFSERLLFDLDIVLNRYTPNICVGGFDTTPFDSAIVGNPQYYDSTTNTWETYYNYDYGCDFPSEGIVAVTFGEDLQFGYGSDLVYFDGINAVINDYTASDGFGDVPFSINGYSLERNRYNIDISTGLETTVDFTTNTFTTLVNHTFINNQTIYLWAVGGGLPVYEFSGDVVHLVPYTPYYVTVSSPTEFTLSSDLLGPTLDVLAPSVVGLTQYRSFLVGEGNPVPFLAIGTTAGDMTQTTTVDGVVMVNELMISPTNVGTDTTKANASFADRISFHVGRLILTDYIGVGVTESTTANVQSGASFIGSWDMNFYDVGGWDETLGVTIQLYTP